MKTLLVAAVLLLSGCGQAHYVAPEIKPYVESFMTEAHQRGQYIDMFLASVDFGDPTAEKGANSDAEGVCVYGERKVVLNKAFWDAQTDTGRMLLVYHELGHCLLWRNHRNDESTQASVCVIRDADGKCTSESNYAAPDSIMHASMPIPAAVAANPDYQKSLTNELFSN